MNLTPYNRPAHVVAVNATDAIGTLLCLHCGAPLHHHLPVTLADLPMLQKRAMAFIKKHRTCRNRRPAVAAVYYASLQEA